jgi:uncharacterized Tic20 family protein
MAEVQVVLATHGATVKHRPPYRPDLNPIGPVLARRKALRRTVGQLMDRSQADECLNFLIQAMFLIIKINALLIGCQKFWKSLFASPIRKILEYVF